MKDIVIITNFATEPSEHGKCRFHDVAKLLSAYNHVELIYSSFYHAGKRQRTGKLVKEGYAKRRIYEIGYKKNISPRRFISHILWGFEVYRYISKRKQPDVIYCAAPSLTVNLLISVYCKKHGIKYVVDIQDLWPEAFEMVLPVKGIFIPIRCIADTIYRRADLIAAVSETYAERAKKVNKHADTVVAYLGAEFDETDRPVHTVSDKIKLVYIGTISASYDIATMLKAVSICENAGKNIKVVVMGDGQDTEEMLKFSEKLRLDMDYLGRVDYDTMMQILRTCDIAVNPIKHGSAGSIINKVGDYAIAGLPVVNSQECSEYRKLLETYHAGINCKNSDAEDMAEKIMYLCDHTDDRVQIGINNRRLAEEKFNRKVTYSRLTDAVENL